MLFVIGWTFNCQIQGLNRSRHLQKLTLFGDSSQAWLYIDHDVFMGRNEASNSFKQQLPPSVQAKLKQGSHGTAPLLRRSLLPQLGHIIEIGIPTHQLPFSYNCPAVVKKGGALHAGGLHGEPGAIGERKAMKSSDSLRRKLGNKTTRADYSNCLCHLVIVK